MSNKFDIVIIGAGMAGSALACALVNKLQQRKDPLHRQNLRIALVESRVIAEGWPLVESGVDNFDARVSALTGKSKTWLEELGVWQEISSRRASAFQKMKVWDANGTGKICFDAADVRAAELGYIVENRLIVAALINRIRDLGGVKIFSGSAVTAVHLGSEETPEGASEKSHSIVELSNGQSLQCDLLVAADGAGSPTRQSVGLELRSWDYDQDAIVCTVKVEKPHQRTAWQCFTQYGPLAFLPLNNAARLAEGEPADQDRLCSIVWSQTRDQASKLMSLSDAEFCRHLSAALENKLGEVESVSKRYVFPLKQQHAVDYVKNGFALVADAAHTVHPLAGQGINLGLADVEVLSELVVGACRRGQPIGSLALLQRYQRQRKPDNLAMMGVMEGFKRLYEPVPLPLLLLRNAGMNFFDNSQWLKNKIIRFAMGVQ